MRQSDLKWLDNYHLATCAALESVFYRHNLPFLLHSRRVVLDALNTLGPKASTRYASCHAKYEQLSVMLEKAISLAGIHLKPSHLEVVKEKFPELGNNTIQKLRELGVRFLTQLELTKEWELLEYGLSEHEIQKIKGAMRVAGVSFKPEPYGAAATA